MTENYSDISIGSAKVVVEELRLTMDVAMSGADAVDGKAMTLFGWASLLTGLIAALNLPWLDTIAPFGLHFWLLVVGIVLYATISIVAIWIARPREYLLPVEAEWYNEYKSILSKDERMGLLSLIQGYNDTIQNNLRIVRQKCATLLYGQILMAILVVLLTVFAVAPR